MLQKFSKKRVIAGVLAFAMIIGLCLVPEGKAYAASQIACNYNLTGNTANYNPAATPYQIHGRLSVSGTNLVDASGNPVQLRGVSLHGIQHTNGRTTAFKDYVNLASFQILRDEWGVNLIRIPVYTEEGGYCRGGAAGMDVTIQNAVNYATQLGMYVIIDWHILSDGNPWNHQSEAYNFFNNYSAKYAGYGNVLYEICNEPNGVNWGTIKSYAESIIPVIRSHDSNAIIIVGTPNWSQYLDEVSYNPIQGYNNIMYTLHFYAASQWHKDALRNRVTIAHNNGLPIFCTEFGICDETGNGSYDFDSAATWMNLLKNYNISYCCWSLSNKNESASMFVSSCTKVNGWTNADLNTTGAWYINYTRPLYEEEMANTSPTYYNGVDYSAVYDYDYYINNYSDLKAAFGNDKRAAIAHFVIYGMNEGRQAKADFNVDAYKSNYSDLKTAFGEDTKTYYMHYIYYGKNEGRVATGSGSSAAVTTVQTPASTGLTVFNGIDYSAVYDYNYYINSYSDLKAAFGNDQNAALAHFVIYGMAEGRQAKSTFDVNSYRNAYDDLRSTFSLDTPQYFYHYIQYGQYEGRIGTGVNEVRNPLTTLNGVDYSAVYDYRFYISHNPDIKAAFGNNDILALMHFVYYGMKEGRQAKEDFNVHKYKNRYVDLQRAFGNDLKSYYLHYMTYGQKEKRSGR